MRNSKQIWPARGISIKDFSPSLPSDDKLLNTGDDNSLPEKHWCRGCVWGINMLDRFVCPFVEGSCARIPETMTNPNPELFRQKICATK